MNPMRKTSYWCHDPNEAIPVMVKLKHVIMPFIEYIQYNNTTNKLPSQFKGDAFKNPHLLSEHDHQNILHQFEVREKSES